MLASTATPAGWVVATTHALWVPEASGLTRLGWEAVDTATWDREGSVLTVVPTAGLGDAPRRWRLRMDDPRTLLVIKEQVRAVVIMSRRVIVDGDRGATVVARRAPGGDRVTWTVTVDPGVRTDDEHVRDTVEDAVAGLRRELGQ